MRTEKVTPEELMICALEGMTAWDVQREYGISKTWLSRKTRKWGICLANGHNIQKPCPGCGRSYWTRERGPSAGACFSCRKTIRKNGEPPVCARNRLLAQEGKKWCPTCRQPRPLWRFNKGQGECVDCRTARLRSKSNAQQGDTR